MKKYLLEAKIPHCSKDLQGNFATEVPVAGATGLEPAASGVTGRRSNQLSYAPYTEWDRLSPAVR